MNRLRKKVKRTDIPSQCIKKRDKSLASKGQGLIANEQGFTLVEVIISIAVLSILCLVFLQLFIKADEIADTSSAADQAVLVTNNAFELIKGIDSVDDFSDEELFGDYDVIHYDHQILVTYPYVVDIGTKRQVRHVLNVKISEVNDIEVEHESLSGLSESSTLLMAGLYHLEAVVSTAQEDIYKADTYVVLNREVLVHE